MNIFVVELASGDLPPRPDLEARKLVVEDNIGEAIHVHIRNARLDFTVRDYLSFSQLIEDAVKGLRDGNC